MQTYKVKNYLGSFAWEYDVEAIAKEATDNMHAGDFADLCEHHNLHMKAIRSINRAYMNGCKAINENNDADASKWFDRYEDRLENWSKKLGISYNRLEDDCTDYRFAG